MCEYQETIENSVPFCTYTESACTLCVLGNGKTYKEAKEQEMVGVENE